MTLVTLKYLKTMSPLVEREQLDNNIKKPLNDKIYI